MSRKSEENTKKRTTNANILVISVGGNITLWARLDRHDRWKLGPATAEEIKERVLGPNNDKLHIREDGVAGEYIRVTFKDVEEASDEDMSREDRDSSVIRPELWAKLANTIYLNRTEYNGFVILHGLDTMAYTASALSFILTNVDVPIIFTGSQLPLNYSRTDALQNIICSITLAAARTESDSTVPVIPEVCIFCHDELYRANRTSMSDPSSYHSFDSRNYRPLAKVKEYLDIRHYLVLSSFVGRMGINPAINAGVVILDVYPGIKGNVIKNVYHNNKGVRGVVLRAYGMGTAPASESFLEALKDLEKNHIVVMTVAQAPTGHLALPSDPISLRLYEHGVIYGSDMTAEAAYTKMKIVLSRYPISNLNTDEEKQHRLREVKDKLQLSLCGEQSRSLVILKFDGLKTNPVYGRGKDFEFESLVVPDIRPESWHALDTKNIIQIQLRILGIEPCMKVHRITRAIDLDISVVDKNEADHKLECILLRETLKWRYRLKDPDSETEQKKDETEQSQSSGERRKPSKKAGKDDQNVNKDTVEEILSTKSEGNEESNEKLLNTINLVADVTRFKKYLLNPNVVFYVQSDNEIEWKKLEIIFCMDSYAPEYKNV